MKSKTYIEARLNKNIRREYYTWKTYKKGLLIKTFTEKEFEKLTQENIDNHFSPQVTLGHGAAEYFDAIKDIDYVKVTKVITTKEKIVKLKSKKQKL